MTVAELKYFDRLDRLKSLKKNLIETNIRL